MAAVFLLFFFGSDLELALKIIVYNIINDTVLGLNIKLDLLNI